MSDNLFGEKIKTVRELKNLSQTDVSKNSKNNDFKGISDGYLSQIENGKIKPENLTIKAIKAIAIGLDEHPFSIFRWSIGDFNKDNLSDLTSLFKELPDNRRNDLLEFAKLFYYQSKIKG